jgi:hypothetical protein
MKHLKMVAVAAVAVGALMAMAGASSAMAANNTALCKTATNPCTSLVGASEAVTASSAGALLTDNIVNVVCATSSTTLHTSGVTAAPQTGTVNSLSFGGCETEGGAAACTVTTQGFPANATLEVTTAPNGKLVVTPAAAGNPGAHVVCSPFINCTFTTTSATLTVEGSKVVEVEGKKVVVPLKAIASGVPLTSTGGLCPKTANWDATYSASTPSSGTLFVEG